ncbi:hypothetical protein A9Q82_07455 [Cycloclasticus sp. 46_120_T64]|nr:hypothetical protein A9Q82_07455 [Cycloclasticus sp. 46_120_T64]
MRHTLVIICLLYSSANLSAIYHWTNQQDVPQYSQSPPRDRSIPRQKIHIKKHISQEQTAGQSLQQSADAIAQSNAERQAAHDETRQRAEQQQQMKENCANIRQSLAALELSGNRSYKDGEGNYRRLSESDKDKRRQQLNASLEKNCR